MWISSTDIVLPSNCIKAAIKDHEFLVTIPWQKKVLQCSLDKDIIKKQALEVSVHVKHV